MKEYFKTLAELLKENEGDNLGYDELLSTKEWRERREIILKRDGFQCQLCKQKGNQHAWWINAPGKIYVRPYDEIEKKYIGEDEEFSGIHIQLHVHHRYYIKDHYPWQYSDDALITLCLDCHSKTHNEVQIPVYSSIDMLNVIPTNKCNRCNGEGYLKEYKYHMRGVCFSCEGLGYKINI